MAIKRTSKEKFHRKLPVRNDVASKETVHFRQQLVMYGRESNQEDNFSSRMSDSTLRSAQELSIRYTCISVGDCVQSSVNEQRATNTANLSADDHWINGNMLLLRN